MITKPPPDVLFLNERGEPLPDWLQRPLQRQIPRLLRDFPAFRGDVAVVQNVLDGVGQRVAQKVAGGLVIDNPNAYVDTAAQNAAIDCTRRHHDLFDGLSVVRDTEEEPAPESELSQGRVLWHKASEWLNAQEEEILIRYLWLGENHPEIARALGLSETAVRSRYSRALGKLRRELTKRRP